MTSQTDSSTPNKVSRARWMQALMAMPRDIVNDVIDGIATEYSVRLTTLPNAGLGLLKFNDSALNQTFYLGEFPVASASVELTLSDGSLILGAAQVMDDDSEFVTRLAIADAILAHDASGSDKLIEIVVEGEQKRHHEQAIRNAMLTRTKVDFSLLSMAEEIEGEEIENE